jgi:hypothetical protein
MEDYSKPKNRPGTVKSNQGYIDRHIIPKLGALKVRQVTRSDVSGLIARMKMTPVTANRVLSCLRKMFNMAEVWGFRDDGTNSCRHIPKYPESGKTRLIHLSTRKICSDNRDHLSSLAIRCQRPCCNFGNGEKDG